MIRIVSFGYKKHRTPAARITIDARNLPNPYQVPMLRPRDGLDHHVRDWLLEHDEVHALIDQSVARIEAVPNQSLTVAVGCSAGRHRAVVIAEAIADRLRDTGVDVETTHQGVNRKTKTTTANGLGWDHQKQRTRLLRAHRDGTNCWWCDKPMYKDPTRNWDDRALHADHTQARAQGGTKADRLLHGRCNESRGDGSRDHQRPALTHQEPVNVFPWPTT